VLCKLCGRRRLAG